MRPKIIDLYSGAGGLSLGAARAGFSIVAAVELDKHAALTHRKNFPNTKQVEGDIRTLTPKEIAQVADINYSEIVGVIGGPPCQGFSTIGHGKVDDDRNSLFHRFFEFVSVIKPRFFLAENVPGLMRSKYDFIRENALDLVKDYHLIGPILVNASEYGAATSRVRYFFIGVRGGSGIRLVADDFSDAKVDDKLKTNVFSALEGLPADIKFCTDQSGYHKLDRNYTDGRRKHLQNSFYYLRMTGLIPEGVGNPEFVRQYREQHVTNGFLMTNHSEIVVARYGCLKYGEQDSISKSQRLDPAAFCPTLRAGTGPDKGSFQAVRPIHYSEPRVINPREAARLQGFPDWFELPDTIWHSFRQIGNSVSPIVAEAILKVIYDHLPAVVK